MKTIEKISIHGWPFKQWKRKRFFWLFSYPMYIVKLQRSYRSHVYDLKLKYSDDSAWPRSYGKHILENVTQAIAPQEFFQELFQRVWLLLTTYFIRRCRKTLFPCMLIQFNITAKSFIISLDITGFTVSFTSTPPMTLRLFIWKESQNWSETQTGINTNLDTLATQVSEVEVTYTIINEHNKDRRSNGRESPCTMSAMPDLDMPCPCRPTTGKLPCTTSWTPCPTCVLHETIHLLTVWCLKQFAVIFYLIHLRIY